MKAHLVYNNTSGHGVTPVGNGNVNQKPAPGVGGGVTTFAAVKQKKTKDR